MNTLESQIEQAFTRWQDGDRDSLNAFIELAYTSKIIPLARTVARAARDQYSELDLAQEAYQTLIRSKKSFSTPDEVYKYLKRSMKHDLIDHFRNANRHESLDAILAEDFRS
jgi:DNA-directed RNA polymerase specialized sigma24 family protein